MASTEHYRAVGARPLLLAFAAVGGLGLGYVVVRTLTPETRQLIASWSGPLWLTLRIAVVATLVAGVLGIAVGYALARGRWPGRDLVESVLSVPIILPPPVLGYYLLTGLSNARWLGRFVTRVLGGSAIFSFRGCVIAAAITAFPFCMRSARSAIEAVDRRVENAAQTIGMPRWRIVAQVTLPLARRGISVGLTLGFLRALGEYGATLLIGGAFRGRTETLSIAVLNEPTPGRQAADLHVMLALAALSLALLAWLQREPRR